jgi:hypothetical protein
MAQLRVVGFWGHGGVAAGIDQGNCDNRHYPVRGNDTLAGVSDHGICVCEGGGREISMS